MPVLMTMTVLPEVLKFMENSYLMDFVAPNAKDRAGLGKVIGIAKDVVNSGAKDHMDMLGSFIRHGLTQEEVESETVL